MRDDGTASNPVFRTALIYSAVRRGFVTAADSGNPLRRAVVRATSQDGRSNGMASTDAQGRFKIKELLGGRYNLN
ncbi:MAG: carboxypeptidase regulatory-like domain-containing protein, partial [Acidobacteria bacterium]|nr:carboxypeptidase regulatory-like domain-containing protein [Acidobacteriota bacterium]